MEKFYIVTNEAFLTENRNYEKNEKQRNDFIKDFFERKGIAGTGYSLSGDGFVNVPFEEQDKWHIHLYVDDNEENNKNFGTFLLKTTYVGQHPLRRFRKGCALLREFQDECVEKQIVINSQQPNEGFYFKEFIFGGYSVIQFFHEDKCYLKMETSTHKSITPNYDGFEEIKGSEFYTALEAFQEAKGV